MKIAVIINSVKEAKNVEKYVDAYLLPLNDLSINYTNTFSLEEIKQIKTLNKEIFIILNKNIQNNELEKLKQTLKDIEKLNINGIVFYDIALVNLKKKLNLKTDLVWHQEHLTTNFETTNYWYEKGVKYTYLSSELTKNEIDEIKENTKAKLFVNIFGYIPMFTSKRHLVRNYLETFNLKSSGPNRIKKEGKTYHINDVQNGTTVFSDYILNIKKEKLTKIDYVVLSSNFIKESAFIKVLKGQNEFKEENGFLYKETIYKVK